MKTCRTLVWLSALFILMVACGGKSAGIGDIPAYPGATELKADNSAIGKTLAKNTEQDEAMRNAMGAGGSTVQKGFALPADATWDGVKAFYEKELKARGWQTGLGGIAGGIDVNSMMGMATQGAPNAPQTMIFSKGKQTLTMVWTPIPVKNEKTLIFSLSTR